MVLLWLSSIPRWLWPPATSTFAAEIDALFLMIALVVGLWLAATLAVLGWLLWKANGRGRGRVPFAAEAREIRWIVVAAVGVFVSDLAIELRGQRLWEQLVSAAPPNALAIRVEARQFAWTVLHPGPDGELGTADDIELQNELHVPVGQAVEVRLRSRDVVHSFFLPTVRLKQDVLPGTEVRRWFVPTEVGTFPIACAELCGFGHYRMGGRLVVHAASDYREWLSVAGGSNLVAQGAVAR
jgi:cytochrome c oxidase subunit 2